MRVYICVYVICVQEVADFKRGSGAPSIGDMARILLKHCGPSSGLADISRLIAVSERNLAILRSVPEHPLPEAESGADSWDRNFDRVSISHRQQPKKKKVKKRGVGKVCMNDDDDDNFQHTSCL